jgi:hypothetical protein
MSAPSSACPCPSAGSSLANESLDNSLEPTRILEGEDGVTHMHYRVQR